MINREKLIHILNLGRDADQKIFSQLPLEQQQAVMLVGDVFGACIDNGVLKYVKTDQAKFSAIGGSYMAMKSMLKVQPGEKITGYSSKSMMVYMDTKFPDIQETDWEDAINSFPSWKVPPKKQDAIHLPWIESPASSVKVTLRFMPSPRDIASSLAILTTFLHRNIELPQELDAIWKISHLHKESLKDLCKNLGIPSLATSILNVEPEKEKIREQEVDGVIIPIMRFKYPRGTEDWDERFTGSYLACYITNATNGIYLKSPKD